MVARQTKLCSQIFENLGVKMSRAEGKIIVVHFLKHTLPTTPESNSQSTGIPNSLYRETAMSLVRKSAYTLCSTLETLKINK